MEKNMKFIPPRFKQFVNEVALRKLKEHDYSKWGIPEFEKYFGKKDIEPIGHDEFIYHHSMSTVCGVLREVGRRNDKEDVEYLIKIAMTMAKKMAGKLQEYHAEERERRKTG